MLRATIPLRFCMATIEAGRNEFAVHTRRLQQERNALRDNDVQLYAKLVTLEGKAEFGDTLMTLLALVVKDMGLHQLDVKTTFLNGEPDEDVYIQQPPCYYDTADRSYACGLHRAIYGPKQECVRTQLATTKYYAFRSQHRAAGPSLRAYHQICCGTQTCGVFAFKFADLTCNLFPVRPF